MDTSGPTARVALLTADGRPLGAAARTGERHSAYLLPLCDELLTAQGLTPAALGAVACGQGPGSFTGLRVGIAVAKGLCLPFDLPFILVSSLHALAIDLRRHSPGAGILGPCIDAGKGEVYGQIFAPGQGPEAVVAQSAEGRMLPTAFAAALQSAAASTTGQSKLVLAGGGVDRHVQVFRAEIPQADAVWQAFAGPSAEAIATLALARIARGERDDLATAVPSYGRPPDITKSKKRAG